VTWVDLQGHASFPLATTIITRETIDTPVGSHECLRYTVAVEEGTSAFWFAPELPGMPIHFTEVKDGTVVSATTMISNEISGSPADSSAESPGQHHLI
jgi:hypothetical protein